MSNGRVDVRSDAFGVVLEDGRGALPFALVHGQPLVACAAWALEEAGAELLGVGTPWQQLVESGRPVVLHDALCPMTPPSFLTACLRQSVAHDCVVVGVRPVTDTVKVASGDRLGATVDRSTLVQVTSPVVVPAAAAAGLADQLGLELSTVVANLAQRFHVETVEAPAEGRRVGDEGDLRVLEALTRPF